MKKALTLRETPFEKYVLHVVDSREVLDVEVPHLHELLLAGVDVGELVEHAADLGHQPRRVHLVLRRLLDDGVRRHREVRRRVVVQSARREVTVG